MTSPTSSYTRGEVPAPLLAGAPARDPREPGLTVDALLCEYARTRDVCVRNEIVARSGPLVHLVVSRFGAHGSLTREDLLQVGHLGLISAVEHFRLGAGIPFASFAAPMIADAVRRTLSNTAWTIRPPRGVRAFHLRLQRSRDRLRRQFACVPSVEELSAHLGAEDARTAEALAVGLIVAPESLEQYSAEHEARQEDGRKLAAALEGTALRTMLGAAITALPEPQRTVIRLRFFEEQSLSEVAETMALPRSQVIALEQKALRCLRGELVQAGWLG